MDDPWMSQPKAAEQLGCSRHRVLAYAADGELETSRIADRTVISRESVARLKKKLKQEARSTATV